MFAFFKTRPHRGRASSRPVRGSRGGLLVRPRMELLERRCVPATLLVDTDLDEVDPSDGKLSLREAVQAAGAGDVIHFEPISASLLSLDAGVGIPGLITVDGAGPDGTASVHLDFSSSRSLAAG